MPRVAPQFSRATSRWVKPATPIAGSTAHPGSKSRFWHRGLPSHKLERRAWRPGRRPSGEPMATDMRAWHYLSQRHGDLIRFEGVPIAELPLTGRQHRRIRSKQAHGLRAARNRPIPVVALQQRASQALSVDLRAASPVPVRRAQIPIKWANKAIKSLVATDRKGGRARRTP